MKTIIVFEESSRVGFGGGQKMSLITCGILKESYNFKFVDFSETTKFDDTISETYPECELVNIGGKSIKAKHRYEAWAKAMWPLIAHFKRDTNRIMEGLEAEQTISYVTNKRSLFYAHYLNKKYGVPFVYHAHLVENKRGFYYPIFSKMIRKAKKVLCVSQTVEKSIDIPQCELLYNPTLNERGYKGEKSNEKFVIAFVNRTCTHKN